MSNLKDDIFDKRDRNLLQAIKEGVYEPLKKEIQKVSNKLDKEIQKVSDKLDHVYNYLKTKSDFTEYVGVNSPKKITDKGHNFLKDHKVSDYLEKECELLKKDFTNKTDAQIFIKCIDWIKHSGREKLVEIRLNSEIPEPVCIELLALFIMEKIKKKIEK